MKFSTILVALAAFTVSSNAIHVTNKAGQTHTIHKIAASQVKNEALAQAKADCEPLGAVVVPE